MLKFFFQLPSLGSTPSIDRKCPRCIGPRGHIHGRRTRQIQDVRQTEVSVVRLKCPKCHKTWTCYPRGLTPFKHRSDRAIATGVMFYFYGLSYRYASAALKAQGVRSHYTQIYRDFIEASLKAQALAFCARRDRPPHVPRLGIDGTGQRLKGQPAAGVLVGTNLDTDDVLEVQLATEDEPDELQSWIRTWRDLYGVDAVMTDGHSNYEVLDDFTRFEVRHLRCQAHFVKAKVIRLRKLREICRRRRYLGLDRILEALDIILHDLSPPQGAPLQELFQRVLPYKLSYSRARRRRYRRPRHYPPGYQAYLLVTEVSEAFADLVAQPVTTNNATERGIGLTLKIRSKLMRGFSKPENILNFARFAAYVRARGPVFNLAEVV